MANRRPQNGNNRRMDFRNDRKNFGRSGLSPWQGGGPGAGLPNLLPLSGGSTEATLALASNIINLLQPRQNPVPSLLDMPIRREFGPNMGRYEYDRGYGPNRMVNQGNFRRTGNYNRAGERINTNRKPFRPNERQQNKNSPKKEADPKQKPAKESEQEDKEEPTEQPEAKETKDEEKKEPPKTRYDDINPQLLKCHICNKSMWDGRSFENHLSGRAHAIMMQKTAESYALTADTMRQEFKIREMKRTRKSGQAAARDFYCAMCDMYAADGALHRTTVGHRKLKKYLHPACAACRRELPTRIELDEHRLAADHLRRLQPKHDQLLKPKPEVMVISTLNMEQMYVREDRQQRRRGQPSDKESAPKDAEGNNQDDGVKESEEGGTKQEAVDPKPVDGDKTVLDFHEDDEMPQFTHDMVPTYSTERGVGRSFLSEMRCFQCRLCHKVLDSEETAEVHLRTWRHHQLFVRLLTKKTMPQETETPSTEPTKRSTSPEQSGNWKRRKTSPECDEANDDHDENGFNGEEDASKGESSGPAAGGEGTELLNDELEDWDQMLDEVLEDEATNNEGGKDEEMKTPTEEETTPKAEIEVEEQKLETEVKTQESNLETPQSPAEEEVKTEDTQEQVEKQKTPPPTPHVLDDKPRASPRTRGRGRGRGRGRY